MKNNVLLLALLIAAGTPLVFAAHDHSSTDKPAAPAAPDAAWLVKAKAEYPLKTCVVSDEKLGGDMGDAIDYIFKQDGKPDRLVRFCCKDCRKDFEKEPAIYLKAIDEAAAKAKKN